MDWIAKKKQFTKRALEIGMKKEIEFKRYTEEARERANEAEGAMVSRYDTFKEEGQYLAAGLRERYEELRSAVAAIKAILDNDEFCSSDIVRLYSIVTVEFENGEVIKFFLFPLMGGVEIEGGTTLITPFSPIGRALIGKEEGDDFNFYANGKPKIGEIVDVQ